MVTLYHFEMPVEIVRQYGSWANRKIIDLYLKFAETMFKALNNKVRYWVCLLYTSKSFRDFVMVQRDGLNGSIDVVIHGLGWFCIQGHVSQIRVYTDKNVNVTFREEMI